jgi:plastocyanin domain-containing protein
MLLDAVVVMVGVGLIAGELWYFLAPRRGPAPAASSAQVQDVRVVVKGGYEPDVIMVEAGRPVRLHFYRDETAECSEQVVFDSLGFVYPLPPFQTTVVEFTPTEPGDYPFRCGKSVLHGRVVAQVGRDAARVNLGRGHAKHG